LVRLALPTGWGPANLATAKPRVALLPFLCTPCSAFLPSILCHVSRPPTKPEVTPDKRIEI